MGSSFMTKIANLKHLDYYLNRKYLTAKVNLFNQFNNKQEKDVKKITSPLLLISEIQRSGGTLLSQLFDGHQECYVHPGEIMIGNPKWIWPKLDLNSSPKSMFDELFESFITYEYVFYQYKKYAKASKSESFPFCFDIKKQKKFFLSMFDEVKPTSQREVLNCYFTSYFNAWIDYQGMYANSGKYVVGFTPRINMIADSRNGFFSDYPDSYLITIVRDPRSWFASAKVHASDYHNMEEAIDLWIGSTKGSIEAKKEYGDRVLLINFENLILDTQKSMELITNHIGIEYNRSLTIPTFNTMPISSDSSYESSKGINTNVLERFRKKLTEVEIDYIDKLALPLYEESKNLSLNM